MKNQTFLLVMSVVLMLYSGYFVYGEEIKWGGYLQTDNRLTLNEKNDFYWQEYRLGLQTEVKPVEKARFYGEVWLRSWGMPTIQNSSDLTDKNKVATWGFDIREAYVDFYGFIFNNLDIRIGRQRIVWGTGDKINPTDNLNPYDLEVPWEFGERLGSNGIKASYYLKNLPLLEYLYLYLHQQFYQKETLLLHLHLL